MMSHTLVLVGRSQVEDVAGGSCREKLMRSSSFHAAEMAGRHKAQPHRRHSRQQNHKHTSPTSALDIELRILAALGISRLQEIGFWKGGVVGWCWVFSKLENCSVI